MFTTSQLRLRSLSALVLVLLATVGCQKRCQPRATQSFVSVTQTQWRLVESTDPAVQVDNFNFLILQFASNGTGSVNRVVSNDMYETPIASILWVPNPKAGLMRIQYSSVPAEGEGNTQAGGQGDLGTFDYRYDLGRELELYEQQTGNFYRYVPFTGVVNPDIECEF